MWSARSYAYNVSGVVEFSYQDYSTKTGGVRTSNQTFTQTYRANLQGYFYDPRAVVYQAGIGYSILNSSHSPETRTLDYSVNANFFPAMKYSASAFAAQTTNSVASSTSLAGYDMETTRYGGVINLNFSKSNGNGRNNNNNNNNNNSINNNRGWIPVWPDVTLSRTHTETKSLDIVSPKRETLDSTLASMHYIPKSSIKLDLSYGLEQYKNLVDSSSYDTKTTTLASTIAVTRDADLSLDGKMTDTKTDNMTGFNSLDRTNAYSARLDFKEKDRLRQSYAYAYYDLDSSTTKAMSQTASATVYYKISDTLEARGGIKYSIAEYVTKATTTVAETKSTLESGGADAGISYRREYAPDFLGPFVFTTSYTFGYGYARYSSDVSGQQAGNGAYYTNAADAGFSSKGWKLENLSLFVSYTNKRDSSAMQNNAESESLKLNFMSRRITKTILRATATYQEQRYASQILSLIEGNQTSSSKTRSFLYDIGADYVPTYYLKLSAGLTRQKSNSTTEYTLSNLTSSSGNETDDDVIYGAAAFNFSLTRNLKLSANLREEYRQSISASTRTQQADVIVEYHIRQILVSMQARWREDLPNNADRTEQQYYFIKVARPF